MVISEEPLPAEKKEVVAPAPSSDELRRLLSIVIYGTGVDLKSLKGPRLVVLQKQENAAQKAALESFSVMASSLGPRCALLQGDYCMLDELLDLALLRKKGAKPPESQRLQAFATLEQVAWATPVLIGDVLTALIALQNDAKVGKPATATGVAIMASFTPKGHGVVQLVLPMLMDLVDDKNWKVTVSGMKLLPACLGQMRHTTKQLSELLSRLLPQLLAGPLMQPRKELQEAAREVLEAVGEMVRNSEVAALSKDVVKAVANPANQQYTQDVLCKLGSTTFMNYIDAASLALLIPIMTRGLKEREQKSRKWSAQILGAIVTLVKDIEYLRPYLPSLLPLLKECVVDPTYEIQREAAKAFGMLTQELPDWSRTTLQPWLCEQLSSKDIGETLGAAHGLSEVLLRVGKRKRHSYLSAIIMGAQSPDQFERRGFLILLDFLVQALKTDFIRYIPAAFPAMLFGILPEPDDPGHRAAQALISRFAVTCPELFLPGFEDAFFAFQHSSFVFPSAVRHQGGFIPKVVGPAMREIYIRLMQQFCERILEHRRYGQDLLTCEDCSKRESREQILVLLETLKEDPDAQVQRQAKHVLRICGGQAKVTKEIMPAIEEKFLKMRQDLLCEKKRQVATSLLESFANTRDIGSTGWEAYMVALPEPPAINQPPESVEAGLAGKRLSDLLNLDAEAAPIEELANDDAEGEGEDEPAIVEEKDRLGLAKTAFCTCFPPGSWDPAGRGAEAARSFCETMAASVAVEALSARDLFGGLKSKLWDVASQYAGGTVSQDAATSAARFVAKAVFGEDSLSEDQEEDELDVEKDRLLRVDDLMLMYGGGHLLLKGTTLELRRNHRYGIIGSNGCGKTTLMKELQAGRVAGMPKDVRCVHVSDADLGNMKVLEQTARAFVESGMPEDAKLSVEEALIEVGFPKDMQDKPVADLSGGWRMRLLLAGAMMKQADILLLDEPTNHLDVHAIEWLCQYLLSLKTGALMVISHEPHFLNAVCTDIVQYRDKKLVYYKGNFDAFKQANAISDDDAEVLLQGNLSLDKQRVKDNEEVADEDDADGDTGAVADKSSEAVAAIEAAEAADEPKVGPVKLVFPIPGKLEGIRNNSKPVMEIRNVWFEYDVGLGHVIKGVSAKLNLGSRVALVGRNGAGKSTLLNLMCGELIPTEHEGTFGEVWQHHNLRVSYIAQHHMDSLGKWFESTPFTYLSFRFQNGWDEEAQRHLMDPKDEEEASSRKEKGGKFGKYGKQVGSIVGRRKDGAKMLYEISWEGMPDQKQNTFENLEKLRSLGCAGFATACDLRLAAISGGVDTRVCSRREIVKHVELFGIDEEMCCNRMIGSFSAGQKSKLALACSMWTRPHLVAFDEPTNYLDVETVDALARALRNFRGGVVVVTHSRDFIEKVCDEEWHVSGGSVDFGKVVAAEKDK